MRAVWRWQRARAKQLGDPGALQGGAVGFLQRFGRALQLTPHLHVLLPEGLWSDAGDWVLLPPPDDEAVAAVLHRLLRQVRPLLAEVEAHWAEEDWAVLRAEGAQHRLALDEAPTISPAPGAAPGQAPPPRLGDGAPTPRAAAQSPP